MCDEGRGVGEHGLGVYLDFADAIQRLGLDDPRERYGNLFEMYERITDEDPYKVPMRIYPAIHYTMGGLWVDYHLMSTIPGLFAIGEANFSDHGANRLGASALMQGLSDGYFIVPYTIGNYLASTKFERSTRRIPNFERAGASVAADTQAAECEGIANGGFVSSRAGQDGVGRLRDVAQRRGPGKAIGKDPRTARRILARREECSAAARRSINRSKKRAAWPISSNWRN